jgi:S-adenosyl-L-methionine hydrolase (adenosine-forming)
LSEGHHAAAGPPRTVFFLSDYGTQDEFVGVVHAVLSVAAPGVAIIDLTHQIAPFDIRAGAMALVRAAPFLGSGVVLAVVDPGVGSSRRGLALEVTPRRAGPAFFVGPDNGLLVAAAELVGGGSIGRAVALGPSTDRARTFDGRDLFAPAAAALAQGVPLGDLGRKIDPVSLVHLAPPTVTHDVLDDGRRSLVTEVLWVDRFGNLQLGATTADAASAQVPHPGAARTPAANVELTAGGHIRTILAVGTFAELAGGQLGLLLDANGHLAVVAGQASAAGILSIGAGESVTLTW